MGDRRETIRSVIAACSMQDACQAASDSVSTSSLREMKGEKYA